MSQLIILPTPEARPQADIEAGLMLHTLNATLAQRVHDHKDFYRKFWYSTVSPDDLLVAMGEYALVLLGAAQENLEHISRLAGIVGKTLHDFILPEDYEPKRAFVVTDGVVTLAPPAEGYDVWGNLVPVE
jgi:hypothetical protein